MSALPCASAQSPPATGEHVPALQPFDDLMKEFVRRHSVPGAALAVARGGKVVYARGFGYSDKAMQTPVQPTALFRIASISKPITAVAVMQLVERGKLKLDEPAWDILKRHPSYAQRKPKDERWATITVRHLLQHRGGFDRSKSGDPMFNPIGIAQAVNRPAPADTRSVILYMLGRPLDFDPGRKMVYSNFGYCVLGRIIEIVSGQTYEDYVKQHVLKPVGVTTMRIGATLPEGRGKDEVWYHGKRRKMGTAVMGERAGKQVEAPYGSFHLEAMDAHGGWIASAVDLVKFAQAFDDVNNCPLLKRESIETLFERPPGSAGLDKNGKPKAFYCGLGWFVRPVGKSGGRNTWHAGLLTGTSTILVRRHDGLTWAVLFNSDTGQNRKTLAGLIDPLVHRAANQVKHWP